MSEPAVPAVHPPRAARVLSIIVIVVGALMVAVGITTYAYTTSQLADQQIDVSAVTPEDPGSMAGDPVDDPFSALAEINAIQHHTDEATGGKTYAELGNVATSDGKTYNKDVTADTSTDGQAHKAGDTLSDADAKTYSARSTAQTSSFLQASLFLSVLAFGVSALIIGLGLIVALIGVTIHLTLRRPRAQAVV